MTERGQQLLSKEHIRAFQQHCYTPGSATMALTAYAAERYFRRRVSDADGMLVRRRNLALRELVPWLLGLLDGGW